MEGSRRGNRGIIIIPVLRMFSSSVAEKNLYNAYKLMGD